MEANCVASVRLKSATCKLAQVRNDDGPSWQTAPTKAQRGRGADYDLAGPMGKPLVSQDLEESSIGLLHLSTRVQVCDQLADFVATWASLSDGQQAALQALATPNARRSQH